jgi:acetylornithine deacetylase/succinyl-diaminopimelate desuccinylase family protein
MSSIADRIDRATILPLARSLIGIPSVSGDEARIMSWLSEWCRDLDLDVSEFARDESRPNLVISLGDPAAGPTLVMNGHLDTVPVSDPDQWRTDPFDPVVSEDGRRLFGRGASDMKASVGVMLAIMELFRDQDLQGCLQAHIVSDEEQGGQFGTIVLMDAIANGILPKPTYCLIGEKSDLKVRNAERGILGMRVRVFGRASHTAAARVTGVNAIALAARAILALEGDIERYHPSVGKPVISINQIHGGVAHNVVPGECVFTIDRRLIPGETRESVVDEITEILMNVAAVEEGRFKYTLEVDPDARFMPPNITEVESPLVRSVWDATRNVLGKEPEFFVQWAGATDGSYYRQVGIDTVGMGPGGENAHGANEAVFIDDLVAQAKIYTQTIEHLLGGS